MRERRASAERFSPRASIVAPRPSLQRGWLGLSAILIALVIVAVLAQTVLRSYGLLGGTPAAASGHAQPAVAGSAAGDAPRGPPSVAAPMERARALQGDVKRGAEDLDRRIDEQTK